VVELKQAKADDPPPAVLCQGVAYGLALQKAWPKFRAEWRRRLQALGLRPVLPTALNPVNIVCAAPGQYWDEWVGDTGAAKTITAERWDQFHRLVAAFAARGLQVTFARIEGSESRHTVNVLTLPPQRRRDP